MWWDSQWDFREGGGSRRVGVWWGSIHPSIHPLETRLGDAAFPGDAAFLAVELLDPFQPGVPGEERIHSWLFW